jgi:hypothetical protein
MYGFSKEEISSAESFKAARRAFETGPWSKTSAAHTETEPVEHCRQIPRLPMLQG